MVDAVTVWLEAKRLKRALDPLRTTPLNAPVPPMQLRADSVAPASIVSQKLLIDETHLATSFCTAAGRRSSALHESAQILLRLTTRPRLLFSATMFQLQRG